MSEINRDAWLDALNAALALNGGEGLSARELSEKTGMADDALRRRLHALFRQGKLEVSRGYRQTLSGISSPVPVYRLKA